MRATRDLLRRRVHLMRTRAERLTPSQNPHSQDNLPASGQQSADTAHRDGVAERFSDPAVQKRLAVDLALMGPSDARRRDVERSILQAAKPHHAHTRSLRRTVPGMGEILSLGLLDERHEIQRFPRVQECVSYGRLVTCAKASAGKRSGTAGTKIGHAYLQGAFSAAAGLCLRAHPTGPTDLGRRENTHGQGKALTVLAHTRARAVDDLVPRHPAFDRHTFRTGERRGAGEPGASRATDGIRLAPLRCKPCAPAVWNA
jgi:hypothetical protein